MKLKLDKTKKLWIIFLMLLSCINNKSNDNKTINTKKNNIEKEITILFGTGFDSTFIVKIIKNEKKIILDTIHINAINYSVGISKEYLIKYKNDDKIYVVIKKDTIDVNTKFNCFFIDKVYEGYYTYDCTNVKYY